MDESPVSIIIVSYNGRRYLKNCLESVLRQVGPRDQVLMVDNASTDGSPDLVVEEFPSVDVIRNETNLGFATACNQGASHASGEMLVFLNQDTVAAPRWLQALVQGLEEDQDIGLTTSRVLLMSQPDRIHLCGQEVHYSGLVYGRGYMAMADSFSSPDDVFAVSGASFAIRRADWEKLNGFDESFHMYYEETDLSWRAQMQGFRCRYIPDAVVYHDYVDSKPSFSRLYYSFRNRVLMLLKNFSLFSLFFLAPVLLYVELVTWGLALQQGWTGVQAKFQANLWLLLHLNEIRKLHNDVQKSRRVPDRHILEKLDRRFEPGLAEKGNLMGRLISWNNLIFTLHYRLARNLLSLRV